MRKLISLVVVFPLRLRSRGHRGTERVSEKLVMEVSTQVLDEIKKDPALAAADPSHVNPLVDKRFCLTPTLPR